MMLRLDAPPLYFMHIPKTAGSSLSRWLAFVYGQRQTISIKLPHHLVRHTLESLRHYRCYTCHFGPGLLDLLERPDLLSMTVLRDPVECAISFVYFRQNQIARRVAHLPPDYLERMQPWVKSDLRELLQVPQFSQPIKDGQTRFLGVTQDWRPYLRDGAIGSSGQPLQWPLRPLQQPDPADWPAVCAAARHRLETMDMVGITERMDETLELLCGRLGIGRPPRLPQGHINPHKSGVDVDYYRRTTPPDLVEMIEAWTASDRELYALANEMLDRQLAEFRAARQRFYSLAPRIRIPVHHSARKTRQWLEQTWPGLAQWGIVKRARALARRWF